MIHPSVRHASVHAVFLKKNPGIESVAGEEMESEADPDVEAALAPWSSKPKSRQVFTRWLVFPGSFERTTFWEDLLKETN